MWKPTAGEVRWPSGAVATVYSAANAEALRGPEHHFAWADELGKWKGVEAWNNLLMGLRLGDDPRALVTTTPRTTALMRQVMTAAGTVETRGATRDNPHLPARFVSAMEAAYGGTRLGRQELEGEMMADVVGALWTRALIDRQRVRASAVPVLRRVVVGVDPPASADGDLLHDGMALSNADDGQRDRGANLALLGDEVIQFTRAEQVAPARWRLSLLSRGLNGSAVDVHDSGTRFVLLDRDSLLIASEGVVRLGDRVRVSASGIGDDVSDGDAARAGSETFLDGRSVAPLAPVHLRWNPAADGGARVTWVRRSRLGWRWGEVDAPIGEESERYRVTVSSKLGERVEMLAEPAITITAAEVAGGGVRVAVVQVGTVASSRAAVIEQGNQS